MSQRLQGRVAIVTGASQGIGAAIARRFIAEGAQVIGIALDADALQQMAQTHSAFTPYGLDLQDHAALTDCVEQVRRQHGRIDILVNNAGFQYTLPFLDTTLEQWQHTHRVNIEAQFVLCKLVAPQMIEQRYGHIVNISSTQSIAAEPSVSAYAATKGGINAFTRALAVDLAEYGILVNALAPGAIATPMAIIDGIDTLKTEAFEEWYVRQRKIPLARPGQPEEIASAALFLASEECSYMTGQVLVVDGGLTITF
ncbi:3-oxoacyl-[acyl-carrier-protein] reductase FabG [Dictyobacter sp. S3.2.2.5]|uniref:3-oxoacyl-[acyl-carrier-protein] reductase FabG n=1 Tax=Dictyobacter halimunensis TaxID=3026934 RepID=A0ABQ6FMH5_9CHLR|nr:3-oxoacyl-[acyl-carrier-protein] reductase FabG [Dictyobacter sp. S3.2.2.5]